MLQSELNMLDLASVSFDQYQRYGVAARAIETLRKNGAPLKILEVGSNIHQLLGRLLPKDNIDYLDLEIPEEMRGKANIIVGDATALSLADGSYDVVVALDVYEHISQELRAAFLHHTCRVARLLTVIGAPFDYPHTVQAENEASAYWKNLFGEPYRWLDEHDLNGLPDIAWSTQQVHDLGYQFCTMKHGDIDLWKRLIQVHFAKEYTQSLRPLATAFDEYYNTHLFEKDFSPTRSYREFIFISKEQNIVNKLSGIFGQIPKSSNQLLESDSFLNLSGQILEIPVEMHREISSRDTAIDHLNQVARERLDLLQSSDNELLIKIQEYSRLNQEGLDEASRLQREINSRDAVIIHLNQVAHDRYDLIIQGHHSSVQLNAELAASNAEIAAFRQSNSWRLTAPLRFVTRQAKRMPRAIGLAVPAIKLGGGVTSTVKKAIKLYLREGIPGIKRGFRLAAISAAPVSAETPGAASAATTPKTTAIAPMPGNSDYQAWIRQYDTRTDDERANIRATQADFANKPLISVLMPTYNPKSEWLIAAIESVRKQVYPHWELCIADDASTDPAVRLILERYARLDPRIKIVIRQKNGHISAASNSALALATGTWVALLDHDDLLPEHALFWVAHSINAHPKVRMIYSDEDKTDENNRRFDPYFKCDWNPDLFYSHNMFSHLGVYETALMRQVGGFREGFEGAQDYDLALRCIEQVKPTQIFHIPRVLYYWRVHAESTALSADSKPYAMIAGERAINEHFERTGVKGSAKLIGYGYQAIYPLPDNPPLASIIIPTRNGLALLTQCINSILDKTSYPNYEILVVDNGSDDAKTLSYLYSLSTNPKIRVIRDDRPFNYSSLNNAAVAQAKGEIIALLNNDIEVISPAWLSEMVSHALRPGVGAVGAKLWYPNDTLQHGGVTLGVGGVAAHAHRLMPKGHYGYMGRAALTQSFSAVTAACLVIRKSIYQQLGGLNEVELAVGYNDVDFCLRLRVAGYRNVWTPMAELYHHESATRGSDETEVNKARLDTEVAYMKQRWGTLLQNDPAYSPNLTLGGDDFSFAWPSRAPALPLHPSLVGSVPKTAPVDRVAKTMHVLKKDGLGLEIGPSHNPMAPKKAGYNVHVLDHATAEELKIKYTGHNVNLDNIEEVDFVWRGEPLSELIGREHCYDWIVASHVIEHVTDFVGFLRQCEKLLAPGGVISLVVPDKRYCFDYYRWPSNTGDTLQAYTDNCVRHPSGAVFDHFANASKMGERITWGDHDSGDIKMVHTLDEAEHYWKLAIKNDEYIDSHRWKFTPSSFRIILNDLQALGLTELAEVGGFDTVGFEFWITLGKRQPDSAIYDRQELSRCMVREIGESIKCLAP